MGGFIGAPALRAGRPAWTATVSGAHRGSSDRGLGYNRSGIASAPSERRSERRLKRPGVVSELEFLGGDRPSRRGLQRGEELRLLLVDPRRAITQLPCRRERADLDRRCGARVRTAVVVASAGTGDRAGLREDRRQRRACDDATDRALAVVDAGCDPPRLR